MKFLKPFLKVLFCFFLALTAQAAVNRENGNFHVSYTDMWLAENMEITRTFNSKNPKDGPLGPGWGWTYGTYLDVNSDGSVVVHEYHNGADTTFYPKKINKAQRDKSIEAIIAAMRNRGTTIRPKMKKLIVKSLKVDEYRHSMERLYGISGEIEAETELLAKTNGLQKLYRTEEGYVRKFTDGKQEFFKKVGKIGKLVAITNGTYKQTLVYDEKTGRLDLIKDTQGRQLKFEWYSGGKRIKSISSGKMVASYTYDGEKRLKTTKDPASNRFEYGYDSYHNMTSVKYLNKKINDSDRQLMEITYWPKTQFASSVTDRWGTRTKYHYGSDPKNKDNHYWTEVTRTVAGGRPVKSRYEYLFKLNERGSRYLHTTKITMNNITTKREYHPECALPLTIKRGNRTTSFKYDHLCLLIQKKSSAGEFIAMEYHPKCHKISKLKQGKDGKEWTEFSYKKNCQLRMAKNNKGDVVGLAYNSEGKISQMTNINEKEKEKTILSIQYTPLGKPSEISMAKGRSNSETLKKIGKLTVGYDDFGEVKRVDSKEGGQKTAPEITRVFRKLLALVRPARVDFNP